MIILHMKLNYIKINEKIGIIKAYKDGKVICESILDLESIPKKSNFFEVLYKMFKSLF